MIKVRNYSKAYGDRQAVDDLSFDVEPGTILGLVGPNGAGKTTTLRSLSGILPPSSGTLVVAGHDITREPLEAKSRLALVPDEPNLFSSLTVREHFEFTARIYGVDSWQDRAAVWVERLELAGHEKKLADELSRGMRQKVAIACALLHDPDVLLLDEPLTGLDPRGIRTVYDAVRERASDGAAVILSSHLLGQIESLCSRFLILRQGKKLVEGSKEQIRSELGSLGDEASLEDIFFEATEGVEKPPLSDETSAS